MAYLNGVPATLPELQALALTNYGHFTSMRVENRQVRGLTQHLDRLVRDCRAVFGTELDRDRVVENVRRAVDDGDEGAVLSVRVTVFDPALDMGHPGTATQPQMLVTTRPGGALPPPPLTAKTYAFQRDQAQIKHIGLFSQLRLRRDAQLAGFGDALFVERDGRVSEGGTWNVGFVDARGRVVWPDADVLPGVTMNLLQQAFEDTVTEPVTLADLPRMRAAFAANTSIGARVITAIDDTVFAESDPVVTKLQELYEAVPGEDL